MLLKIVDGLTVKLRLLFRTSLCNKYERDSHRRAPHSSYQIDLRKRYIFKKGERRQNLQVRLVAHANNVFPKQNKPRITLNEKGLTIHTLNENEFRFFM